MVDQRIISFLRVYETGSFTKASDMVALTQPAVSKHVRSLEEDLGVQLFSREKGNPVPTREGVLVAKYARRMMSLDHNMRKDLKNMQNRVSSLKIGITHTAESNASTEALALFATSHADMKIKVVSEDNDRLYAMLRDYRLDMAITEGHVTDDSFCIVPLDTDCLMLAVPPEHPLAGRESITIEELKKEKLIIRSRHSGTRSMFVSSLEAHDMQLGDFNILMEIDNIAAVKDLIRQGFGVSVLARSACYDEWRKKKISLLSIENLSMKREVNLILLKNSEYSSVAEELVSCYRRLSERV